MTVEIHSPPAPPSITGVTAISCSPYNIELTASSGTSGTFNWNNGGFGPVTNVYEGGLYRVWLTAGSSGCISHSDTTIPPSPESYFGWFPSGCYNICEEQFPLTLYGPPGLFKYWDWIDAGGGGSINSGTNAVIDPLTIASGGSYQLGLGNDFCSDSTDVMDITTYFCDCLPAIQGMPMFSCIDTVPYSYTLQMTVDNTTGSTAEYTFGLVNGGLTPFKATLTPGPNMLTFVVSFIPPPPFYVEVSWPNPSGSGPKCYEKVWIDENTMPYPCGPWPQQKHGNTSAGNMPEHVPTGMLVYPNPAGQAINVNYSYGGNDEKMRVINVFDMNGRKIATEQVQGASGTRSFNSANWVSGVYIIRMEEDGKALHTQRVTVTH